MKTKWLLAAITALTVAPMVSLGAEGFIKDLGSCTMATVREEALDRVAQRKPMSYHSAGIENKTFTVPFAPTADKYLVFHSDDGFKLVVKVNGQEVYTFNRLNNPQHAPNVDGNPPATKSLHRVPFTFKQGEAYTLVIDYRNKIYGGETDIDGITVFAMRAFPADIAFVDMGGNPMVFLPSVHTSELEELAAKNLSKANLLKALETKLFRVQLLDFSADGEGIAMRLVSLDENGNPQGDYEDITLRGSPATSQPAIAFWGASFLSTEAETYFRNKEVAFIHNAEIGVEELSGRLIIKEDENKRATVKGLLVTQGNNPKNRIIYEVGNPITFKMDSEGNPQLQAAMSVQPKHQAGLFDANGKFQIINGQAPCVLSWDFNTDATAKKADAEANGGRDDINKLEFGATGWPVAASPTTGHPSDKAASVNPARAQNPAGALSHTVTYKNMVDVNANNAAIPDDANVVTINHIRANHRKTYSMRGVFGFNKDKTPQELWEQGNKAPYQLQGAVAGQYRAYDFTLRVALEKFVGQPIPPEKKPTQNADGTWDFSGANQGLHEMFNTPSLTNEQVNDISSGAAVLPIPEQAWKWRVRTSNEGELYDELKEITLKFGVTRQLTDQTRAQLVAALASLGAEDQVAVRTINGNPVRSYLGRWVQMAAEGAEATGGGARFFFWDVDGALKDVTLVGVGVRPLAFTAGGSPESPITWDEVRATIIHEAKHLRQYQNMAECLEESPYWKLWNCKVRYLTDPPNADPSHRAFHELEAYLEEMIDPRVSYRCVLKRGTPNTIFNFFYFYNEAVKLVNARPQNPSDNWNLGVQNSANREAALQILKRAWKIVKRFYPELQKDGYEYPKLEKPSPIKNTPNMPDENFDSWDNP